MRWADDSSRVYHTSPQAINMYVHTFSLVFPLISILLEHHRLHSFYFLSPSQPCILRCRQRWPWSLYCTRNLLQISQGIQSTCEFINTDLKPCLPSSVRVTRQWQRMPNSGPFSYFFSIPIRLALTVTLPPPWGQWPQPLLFLFGPPAVSSPIAG